MSASGRSRVWDGSRARSKRSSSRLRIGSTSPSWSTRRILPPGRVTRASSATTSSGRRTWWSTRRQPDEVEVAVREGERLRVPGDERAVRRGVLARGGEVLLGGVDADDLADERRERVRERAGAATDVERALVAAQRGERAARTRVTSSSCALGLERIAGASARSLIRPPCASSSRGRRGSRTRARTRSCLRRAHGPRAVDAVPDERDAASRARRAGQADRERVHRDRPHDRRARPVDDDLGAREIAAEAVGVPDRDDPDPGLGSATNRRP